jgi:hypothetical protein
MLPDPEDPGAATARTAANLFAWSHVDAGFVLLDQDKLNDAAAQFFEVAKWPSASSFSDAYALAGNELACLRWAREDPDRSQRAKWLSLARARKLADDRDRADMIQLMNNNDRRPRRPDQIWQPLSDLEYWQQVLGISK